MNKLESTLPRNTLCSSLVEISSVVLEKKDENVKSLQTDAPTDERTDRQWKRGDQKSSLELSAQLS